MSIDSPHPVSAHTNQDHEAKTSSMVAYCNLFNERNALLAAIHEQTILIDQCPGEKRHALIDRCDQIHDQLELLEQEEDARDQQENLQSPIQIQGFDHFKDYDDDISVENLCFAFSGLALDESFEQDDDDCLYYCGDDGLDADSGFYDDDGNDSGGDSINESERCLNCELSERICARRDCETIGHCRLFEQLGSVCVCYDDEY